MNYEKFGICVTIAVVICLCGFAGIVSSGIDLSSGDNEIPHYTASTKTTTPPDILQEYCKVLNIDCNKP